LLSAHTSHMSAFGGIVLQNSVVHLDGSEL
jgi:hypothetical protein